MGGKKFKQQKKIRGENERQKIFRSSKKKNCITLPIVKLISFNSINV